MQMLQAKPIFNLTQDSRYFHCLNTAFSDELCDVKEALKVAYLDHLGQVAHVLSVGGDEPDRVSLPVRIIMQEALNRRHDRFLILHNHPSGDPQPSPADITSTRMLCRTAIALNIELVDHLIVTPNACFSFRGAGLI